MKTYSLISYREGDIVADRLGRVFQITFALADSKWYQLERVSNGVLIYRDLEYMSDHFELIM